VAGRASIITLNWQPRHKGSGAPETRRGFFMRNPAAVDAKPGFPSAVSDAERWLSVHIRRIRAAVRASATTFMKLT
jgi:hypothetical protein